jgi:hypothetical protein
MPLGVIDLSKSSEHTFLASTEVNRGQVVLRMTYFLSFWTLVLPAVILAGTGSGARKQY